MAVQLVDESVAEDTYNKMSPRYVNVYKKNNMPIFPFNHETLNGLAVLTEYTLENPDDLDNPKYFYTSYEDLLKDVEIEKKIKYGTPIVFTGKIGSEDYKSKTTCYGKIRISKILDADIDKLNILKDPYTRMDAKAAVKLSSYLNRDEKGVEKRSELQKLALRAVTQAGVVTFDFKTLFAETDTETYKEICKIADSDELTDKQKLAMLTKKYADYEKEVEGKFSTDLKNELNRAARVKISSISALNMPQFIISGIDEKPVITRGSLLTGYNEKDMIYHSIENRSLQSIKVSGVPSSGWLNRQISYCLNSYIYRDGEDLDNQGLLIPRYKALGRTTVDGKVFPTTPIARPSEDDLVLVRSIVTKNKGDLNVVTPDLLGKDKFDFTDGAAIGLSFGTSLMESTTQTALGLKHGGHERKLDLTSCLIAPKDCTFREEGKWIYLKVRGAELKYPRPDNLVTVGKSTFKAGEEVCYAYNTTSPIYKLNCLINLLRARGSNGQRYFEKENVLVSDCYAINDGIIKYDEDKNGNIRVYIDNEEYLYNPKCMYYFPDGAKVKKFDRICNGVVRMDNIAARFNKVKDINSTYIIFRKQFYEVTDDGFLKTGITDLHSMQEELIELLFAGLTRVVYNPKTSKIEEIEYQGTQSAVLNKPSFYTTLSYGFASKSISKALKGEVSLQGDVMSEVILGLLVNDKLG